MFRNWESWKAPLSSQDNAAYIFVSVSPEIEAGTDEKQDVYFYWPIIYSPVPPVGFQNHITSFSVMAKENKFHLDFASLPKSWTPK